MIGGAGEDHLHRVAADVPGRHPVPAYAASKSGIGATDQGAGERVGVKGVQVNAIAPGYIATDNTAALRADPARSEAILARIPAGRWGAPGDSQGAWCSWPRPPRTT